MSDLFEIPRALKRQVDKMFKLPSGNVVRVTRVFRDKNTNEPVFGAVYDGVSADGFEPSDTKSAVFSPAFIFAHGTPY